MSDYACLDYEVTIHLEQDAIDPVLPPDADSISEDVHYLLILAGVLHTLDEPTRHTHVVSDLVKTMYSITYPFRVASRSSGSPSEVVLKATSEKSGSAYYTLVGMAERLVNLHLEFAGLDLASVRRIVDARYAHDDWEMWASYIDQALATLLRIRSIQAFKVTKVSSELGDFGIVELE